jgi:GDP-4-dehydro-6-deoxy-D-mannose reductase
VKKVLITGIEGFVGSYLADYLALRNYEIFGIHLNPCPKEYKNHYPGDIRNFSWLLEIVKKVKPEIIFHLAAQSSVGQGEKEIRETFTVNVDGTLNILEAIRIADLKTRIIYISSCEVYGPQRKKLTEDSLLLPVSFYATTKVCAEYLCRYYHQVHGFDIVILRPFSHTGPGQSEQFIFPKIARKIAEIEKGISEPIIEIGNLNLIRDYSDVRDIVRAYELALRYGKSGEIYNITSEKPYKLRTEVNYLLGLAIKKIKLKVNKALFRKFDIPRLTGCAQKFKKLTGWRPRIEFRTTLTELLDYYRKRV